jgi:dolichol-phosphate mannosyltransferase
MDKEFIAKFVKFGVVGTSGILVNSGVLWFGHDILDFPVAIASIFAVLIAIYYNFNLNNLWTWRGNLKIRQHSYLQRVWRYYLSAAIGAAINYVVLLVLVEIFDVFYLLSNLIGIFFGMFSNFLLGDRWVFRSQSEDELLEEGHETTK